MEVDSLSIKGAGSVGYPYAKKTKQKTTNNKQIKGY